MPHPAACTTEEVDAAFDSSKKAQKASPSGQIALQDPWAARYLGRAGALSRAARQRSSGTHAGVGAHAALEARAAAA